MTRKESAGRECLACRAAATIMEGLQTLSAPGQVCDKHCNRLTPQLSLALLDQTGRFAGERPVTFVARAKGEETEH
jgi:hypothetical protein